MKYGEGKSNSKFILNLIVWLFGDSPQVIGPEGFKFSGFEGKIMVIRKFGEISWFNNSSQTIGHKELKFSGFDGGYPRVVIMKFCENQSVGLLLLFFNFLAEVTTLCMNKPPLLDGLCCLCP